MKEECRVQDYYVSKRRWLMHLFDFIFQSLEERLAAYHGDQYAGLIVHQSRKNFEEILPLLPYVGGMKNYYTPIIVINGMVIAMFRAMRETGKTAEDVVRVWAEAADTLFARIPARLAHLGGQAIFSKPVVNTFRKQSLLSQERRFLEDWVYTLLEGDGEEFDVGFEFSECAVIKLYQAMGTVELAPFCNFADVTYSHYLGLGLDASETLGMGCERCRMLFKKGRETLVSSNLVGILPLAQETIPGTLG